MGKYFSEIPDITYGNILCKDVTARVRIKKQVFGSLYTFYPYTIQESETADDIAFNYYDDPYMVWLIYLANDIVDPYFQWPMDYQTFVRYIIKKYGSVAIAKAQINGYQHKTEGYRITSDTYNHGQIIAGDFQAVYAFDEEDDANEERRFIKLLDKRFAGLAKDNLSRLLNG